MGHFGMSPNVCSLTRSVRELQREGKEVSAEALGCLSPYLTRTSTALAIRPSIAIGTRRHRTTAYCYDRLVLKQVGQWPVSRPIVTIPHYRAW